MGRRSCHWIANLLPPPRFLLEKHTHDTADLISGGDPRFARSSHFTSGEDLLRFKTTEGVFRLERFNRCNEITVLRDALDLLRVVSVSDLVMLGLVKPPPADLLIRQS